MGDTKYPGKTRVSVVLDPKNKKKLTRQAKKHGLSERAYASRLLISALSGALGKLPTSSATTHSSATNEESSATIARLEAVATRLEQASSATVAPPATTTQTSKDLEEIVKRLSTNDNPLVVIASARKEWTGSALSFDDTLWSLAREKRVTLRKLNDQSKGNQEGREGSFLHPFTRKSMYYVEASSKTAKEPIIEALRRLGASEFGGMVTLPNLARELGTTAQSIEADLRRLERARKLQLDPLSDPLGVPDSEQALGIHDPVRGLLYYASPVNQDWLVGRRGPANAPKKAAPKKAAPKKAAPKKAAPKKAAPKKAAPKKVRRKPCDRDPNLPLM